MGRDAAGGPHLAAGRPPDPAEPGVARAAGSASHSAERKFWWIIGLLFLICLLNYFDRQTLSILKTTLKAEIGFDDVAYSHLVVAFMLPYIAMYLASGWIIDRYGTRITMSMFAVLWSVASVLSGLTGSFGQLAAARALLGAAEPITFPLSQRIILNWAPERRRAFAMSMIAPAGSVGAVLAPPLVAGLAIWFSWRAAFIVPGIVGILVAFAWWKLDRLPPDRLTVVERQQQGPLPVRNLLANRDFWAIVAARVVSDPVWFFLLFWMPGFLQDGLQLSLADIGLVAGIPYLAALVVCLTFGRLVDFFVARGAEPARVQLWLLAGGAALMPLAAVVTSVRDVWLAIAIITVLVAVAQSWFAGSGVLLASRIPHRLNATALGFIGAIGASAGLALNLAAGTVIERFGYTALFGVLAFMHPLAAIILWSTLGRRRVTRHWKAEDEAAATATPA